jgi:uncharacterized membrane protein YkvA (DUF1232 family)
MRPDDLPYPNPTRPLSLLRFARHLPGYLRLLWSLFRDPRVGKVPKALLIVVLAYIASPFDILGDWLPLLGIVDDLALLLMATRLFLRLSPRPVVEEHLQQLGCL